MIVEAGFISDHVGRSITRENHWYTDGPRENRTGGKVKEIQRLQVLAGRGWGGRGRGGGKGVNPVKTTGSNRREGKKRKNGLNRNGSCSCYREPTGPGVDRWRGLNDECHRGKTIEKTWCPQKKKKREKTRTTGTG